MLFQSARIYLRKMTADDVTIYHTWRNDMEVMRTTNPSIDLCTLDSTQEFVNQVILGSSTSKSYMIIDKGSETPIGIVSLIQIDYKNRNAECIIDIGEKAYWGKGYGMEALKLLLDYAFLELNLHRVSLRVFSFNKKAIALYERMGFKHEGISREYIFRDGKWSDVFHMGILQREYVATTAAFGN
ncbi:GNAT family protein [Brevibacillus laterosporus]|uniref:GNAT family N-acetyltransferase n=1 Tax=Brevibacillus laterosporus TaxID=1465 RepID=UPI000CE5214E|nr:GNAT family protein [Brevibacillus laterosporus]MBG9773944.1 acetyltransferase [Brevibacillus laterosporus]MBG9797101.1 acetyltransferase [Brevibacillus laterosporus]MCR8938043.1 GNAT family N-acetyltransferase [Brevibacillus laterosporus]MCZ0840683.1 GNAT family protein [Brevibacillus laterosporus]MCZ0847480.1 GNAT family protein [Brevibacillus laterosporus]